jgi:hypothetical protein
LDNSMQSTKEICEHFDKEDGLPIGTTYRKHLAQIYIPLFIVATMAGLFIYDLIK